MNRARGALCGESKGAATFGQQAEPRAGAATEPSDDEARVVADLPSRTNWVRRPVGLRLPTGAE
jgi:hypothetical protein